MIIDVAGTPVELELDEDDIVLDAMLIVRTSRIEHSAGVTSATIGVSEQLDSFIQIGLLQTALTSCLKGAFGD